jgi:TolB-like protein
MTEGTYRPDLQPPPVDRLSQLWRRINDHKMVQWSVAYVALAYGAQHGVELTSDAFEWPHAVVRLSMLLLVLGLPLVMTLAWYHGERASAQFTKAELSILSALLVISSLLFYVFVRPSAEVAAGPKPAVQQGSVAEARTASASVGNAISIAVLPFANVSGDAAQEFFSDGMTDEIIAALAKVPSLQVVARTSAFQFKGEKKDLRAIGQALNARYLIDGSVRKAGDRVRITAQLVEADNGVGVWTDSYDRELKDIFETQSDIAQAIAGALRVPLGLQQGERLVSNRTNDLESYQQYLRARALYRARANDEATAVLKPLVVRDPKYAPAWALLASANMSATANLARRSGSIGEARRLVQDSDDKAEMAAREAIRLDPQYAGGYARLGGFQYLHKWVAGEDLIKQALALDPSEPETLDFYSLWLATAGRLKESLGLREQLGTLEPFVPAFNISTAAVRLISGQGQAAIRALEAIPADAAGGYLRNVFLSKAYAAAGRYNEAADTLLLITSNLVSRRSLEDAARIIRSAPTKTKAPEALPALERELGFVYAYVGGAPDHMMEGPEHDLEIHRIGGYEQSLLWSPEYAPLRKTERFKALMRKTGLVEYWRARGWPDLCRPMGTDDFVCD